MCRLTRTMKPPVCASLYALALLLSLLASPAVWALAPSPAGPSARALVATALAQVARAREALHRDDSVTAKEALNETRLLLEMVQAAEPNAEASALVDFVQAKLAFEDNRQALADLVPLLNAMASLPKPAPQSARQLLAEAKTALERNDRPAALKSLQALDRALMADRTDLPVAAAAESLERAMTDLSAGKPPADEDLLSVEKNLILALGGGAGDAAVEAKDGRHGEE